MPNPQLVIDIVARTEAFIKKIQDAVKISTAKPVDLSLSQLGGIGGGMPSPTGAKEFFDIVQEGATKVGSLRVEYKQFKDLATGEILTVPVKAIQNLKGASGEAATAVANLKNELDKYEKESGRYQKVGEGRAVIDYEKAAKQQQQALKATKKDMDAMAASASQFMQKSANMSGRQVEDAKKVAMAIKAEKAEFDKLFAAKKWEEAGLSAQKIRDLNGQFKELEAGTKRGAGAIRNWADNLTNAIKQTIAYTFSLGLMREAMQLVNQAIQFTINLNKEMIKIQALQVEGAQSDAEIRDLAKAYNGLAKEMGVTTIEVAQGSVEWLRQGKTIEETQELLKASTMLSKLGALDAASATEYLTSTLNSYNMEAEESVDIVNKLIAVDNISATSARELATALRYSAASGAEAGVSVEKLISYIGVLSSTTRQNAESIGQAMKTIFARMQDIRAGAIDEDGLGINNVARALERVDVPLMDATGGFRDLDLVLEDLAKKWDTLSEIEQANIAKAIAGVRQQNLFLILMNNMNDALALQEAQYTSAGLAADRYGVYLNGLEATQNKLTANLESLFIGDNFDPLLRTLMDIANAVVDIVKSLGGIPGILRTALMLLVSIKSPAIIGAIVGGFKAIKTSVMDAFGKNLFKPILDPSAWISGIGIGITALFMLADAIETPSERLERLNEQFEKSQSNIQDISNTQKDLNSLWREYDDLNKLNKTIGLTNDQQEKFVSLQNQIKQVMPEVNGQYNAQGEFIIKQGESLEKYNEILRQRIDLEQNALKSTAKDAAQAAVEVIKSGQLLKKSQFYADVGSAERANLEKGMADSASQLLTYWDYLDKESQAVILASLNLIGDYGKSVIDILQYTATGSIEQIEKVLAKLRMAILFGMALSDSDKENMIAILQEQYNAADKEGKAYLEKQLAGLGDFGQEALDAIKKAYAGTVEATSRATIDEFFGDGFGKAVAENIVESVSGNLDAISPELMQEAKTLADQINLVIKSSAKSAEESLSGYQKGKDVVQSLIKSYDELNGITLEQFNSLKEAFPDTYMQALYEENGVIKIRISLLDDLMQARRQEAIEAANATTQTLQNEKAKLEASKLALDAEYAKMSPDQWAAGGVAEAYNAKKQAIEQNIVAVDEEIEANIRYVSVLEDVTSANSDAVLSTEELSSALRDNASDITMVNDALQEQANNGQISMDTALDLIDAGYAAAIMVDSQTGAISINTDAMYQNALAKAQNAEASAWMAFRDAEAKRPTDALTQSLYAQAIAATMAYQALKGMGGFKLPQVSFGGGGGGRQKEDPRIKELEAAIKMHEKEKAALKEKLDVFKKYIDAQKESLELAKETNDYNKQLEEKNKEISEIDAELLEIQFDNSEEAQRRRIELEKQKAEKVNELNELQTDREYDLQIQALDNVEKVFEESIDRQVDAIDRLIEALREQLEAIRDAAQRTAGGVGGAFASIPKALTPVFGELAKQIADTYGKMFNLNDKQKGKLQEQITEWLKQGLSIDEVRAKARELAKQYEDLHKKLMKISSKYPKEATKLFLEEDDWDAPYNPPADTEPTPGSGAYHEGGLVADLANFKESEVFAKLLKGEFVANDQQMRDFVNKTIPAIAVAGRDSTNFGGVNIAINVQGSLDKSVVPNIKTAVFEALNMAVKQKGKQKNAFTYSV